MTTRKVTSEDVRLERLRVHVARPDEPHRGGMLLCPTLMGIDGPTMAYAEECAREGGFTVVVWDPYDGEEVTDSIPEMLARSKGTEDRAVVRDLTAIVDYMERELELDSIACVGWCFGGRLALVFGGEEQRLKAVASHNPTIYSDEFKTVSPTTNTLVGRSDNPGHTLDAIEQAGRISGPVLICQPGSDFTPEQVYEQLMTSLRSRTAPTLHQHFPGAAHNFNFTPGEPNATASRIATATTVAFVAAMTRGAAG